VDYHFLAPREMRRSPVGSREYQGWPRRPGIKSSALVLDEPRYSHAFYSRKNFHLQALTPNLIRLRPQSHSAESKISLLADSSGLRLCRMAGFRGMMKKSSLEKGRISRIEVVVAVATTLPYQIYCLTLLSQVPSLYAACESPA
jgi:hypothetical protein